MSQAVKCLVLSAFGLFLIAVPLAQAPSPTDGQSDRPSQAEIAATFRASVDLVTTDVIVRDSRGQFVSDLDVEDFEVLEDGVLQEIASLVLIHGGRAFNMQAPLAAPVQEGIILPTARPVNDVAGRIFVFFIDDLHFTFRDTARVRDLLKRMRKNLVHEGDMFGILSTGPSSLSVQLTYNLKVLDDAIERIAGDGLSPADIMLQQEGPNGPQELRYRAHVAFKTAYDLVRNLESVKDRRKALLYVSSGYDFNPFELTRLGKEREMMKNYLDDDFGNGIYNPFEEDNFRGRRDPGMQGRQFADTDLAMELVELTRAANRANATMYTIDPRGLTAGMDIDSEIEMADWNVYVRKTQDSLRTLAQLTGGIAIVNTNNFDDAFARIDAETSDYYVLGYYSTNPDPLRRTRQLKVNVNREDMDVRSRTSYSIALPDRQ